PVQFSERTLRPYAKRRSCTYPGQGRKVQSGRTRQLSCSTGLASQRSPRTYSDEDDNRQKRCPLSETSLCGFGLSDNCQDRTILLSKARTHCEKWDRDSQKRRSTRLESPPSQARIAGLVDSISR